MSGKLENEKDESEMSEDVENEKDKRRCLDKKKKQMSLPLLQKL